MESYAIGLDYGTDSVRCQVVDTDGGKVMATSVFEYPRWKEGLYCDAGKQQFRQHPRDHVEGLEFVVKDCVGQVGADVARKIVGIGVDTTGSSPMPVDARGVPLGMNPDMEENPNAMMVLWKDHTAVREAGEINEHSKSFKIDYLQYCGGIYSSEWFWAKLLHVLRVDESLREHIYTWVEHCDWVPFLLTGGTGAKNIKRSVCAAGHKALWCDVWKGLPPDHFFSSLDPLLTGVTDRMFDQVYTSDKAAGTLSANWAKRLGLSEKVVVAVGAFDAHMGAVGGQVPPYALSRVMGTSTCDILVAPIDEVKETVKGICGQVPGSVIPGMMGLEAGQSAFGDCYAWVSKLTGRSVPDLSACAEKLPLSVNDPIALDWLNGRRTPDADQGVMSAVVNINLGTGPAQLFKTYVEATCLGARAIVERFIEQGIPVRSIIGIGGVARKSPYIMQVLADVLGRPIQIHASEQTCALGAAMFGATAAGVFARVEQAMEAMGQGFERVYQPDAAKKLFYDKRFAQYKTLAAFVNKKEQ